MLEERDQGRVFKNIENPIRLFDDEYKKLWLFIRVHWHIYLVEKDRWNLSNKYLGKYIIFEKTWYSLKMKENQ